MTSIKPIPSIQLMPLDNFISDCFLVAGFVYTFTLGIKVLNSNYKLFVNKLIIISIISGLLRFLLAFFSSLSFYLFNSPYSGITLTSVGLAVSTIGLISFITILHLRNLILIRDGKMRVLEMTLYLLTVLSLIGDIITGYMTQAADPTYLPSLIVSVTTSFYQISYTLIMIYDTMSNIYLFIYYQEYYFRSKSVMKHLRPQMIYRRNWVVFVIICDILCFSFIVTTALGFIVAIGVYVPPLVLMFQLNTMIDFVQFDTVRNEITIGDHTLYLLDDSVRGYVSKEESE